MTNEKGRQTMEIDHTDDAKAAPETTIIEFDPHAPRPLVVLSYVRQAFPDLWRDAQRCESLRRDGAKLGWPAWCYLPMAISFGLLARAVSGRIVDDDGEARRAVEKHPLGAGTGPALISALAAWRLTKGVYRFDPDVLRALWGETERPGNVPVDTLRRLPEWSSYIEIPEGFDPGAEVPQLAGLRGFWALLDWGVEGVVNSRIVFLLDLGEPFPGKEADASGGAQPTASLRFEFLSIPLASDTLEGSVNAVISESLRVSEKFSEADNTSALAADAEQIAADMRAKLAPLLSTALYLCAANAEIAAADGSNRRPGNPVPKRTKKRGGKLFAATEVREWRVAFRIGAALRQARAEDARPPAGSGAGGRPRAHVRRAHWHTYLTGPRSGEQTPILKWLPPIAVNVDDADDLPAVVRDVE